jgi:hypothetical protein
MGDGSVVLLLTAFVVLVLVELVLVVDGATVVVAAIDVVGTAVVVMVEGASVGAVAWVTGERSVSTGGAPSERDTVHPAPRTRTAVRLANDRRTDTPSDAIGHPSSGDRGAVTPDTLWNPTGERLPRHGVTLSP